MASPKYDYGVLTYYPAPEAWVISFVATDTTHNLEQAATLAAEGIRPAVFEVLGVLGSKGWIVFQIDGYVDKDFPVYHLRRVRD